MQSNAHFLLLKSTVLDGSLGGMELDDMSLTSSTIRLVRSCVRSDAQRRICLLIHLNFRIMDYLSRSRSQAKWKVKFLHGKKL